MPSLPELIFPGAKEDTAGSGMAVSYDLPLPVSASPQGQSRAQGKETGGSVKLWLPEAGPGATEFSTNPELELQQGKKYSLLA